MKLGVVLFDFGTALDLNDKKQVRSAKNMMTAPYISKDFVREYFRIGPKFYQSCDIRKLKQILKRRDYAALALSAYHLLTDIRPYSYTKRSRVHGKFTNAFAGGRTLKDYLLAISDFKDSPIDFNKVKEKQDGEAFAEIFKLLLDPYITGGSREGRNVDKVYKALQNGINIPGFSFVQYKPAV